MTTATIFSVLLIFTIVNSGRSISVPTGKLTPITPAKSTPRPTYHKTVPPSAPVVEYTEENPEPPPLDPSYVPVTYKFINALIAHGNYYVPIRLKMPVYAVPAPAPAPAQVDPEENSIDSPPSKFDKTANKYSKKPLYFVPKPVAYANVPTKGGYPKKAVAQPSEKQFWYYQNGKNYY